MAIPQQANAVFYHPLDSSLLEALQSQTWSGFGVSFTAGKVAGAMAGGTGVSPLPGVYPTGVGATRLAFAMWSRSLGPSAFSGPPPQFFEETDRAIMTAMGFPASALGGFT